jgi:hypothetical protein
MREQKDGMAETRLQVWPKRRAKLVHFLDPWLSAITDHRPEEN